MIARILVLLLLLASAPARAATWVLADDCLPEDQVRLLRIVSTTEKLVGLANTYAKKMTGAYNDSYNFLYWFSGWLPPFPAIVRAGAEKLAEEVGPNKPFFIFCHDQSLLCDGVNAAHTRFTEPVIYFCDLAWQAPDHIMISYLNHEINHYALGTDDYGMTGAGDARLAVLSGSFQDPSWWWITTTCSYNWEYFLDSSGGGCSVGPRPRGLALAPAAAALAAAVRRPRRRRVAKEIKA